MDVKYHKRAARVNLLAIFFFSLPFFDNENEGAMDIDRVTFTAKALHQRADQIFTSSANVRFHLGLVRLKLADFLRRNLSFFFFVLSFLAACNSDFTITTSRVNDKKQYNKRFESLGDSEFL